MIALVHTKEYDNHDTGNHPENKERIRVIMNSLEKEWGFNHRDGKKSDEYSSKSDDKIDIYSPELASNEDILRVHTKFHVDHLKSFCNSGGGYLDLDTVVSKESYRIAKLAAGGAITASKLVLEGYNSAYSIARPPGHHATKEKGMGFCLFNNMAIAIEHLKEFYGIKKFMIFDIDAHYGNGTAEIFINDPDVLYLSIHQDPRTIFPGSGFIEEIGSGEGEGCNINIPLPPGSTNQDYKYVIERLLEPVAHDFNADFYFLDVGFDAHKDDPLSRMMLDDEFYPWITSKMEEIAGKMVLILEGGYNLPALSRCNMKIINVLRNDLTNDTLETINEASNNEMNVSDKTKKIFHNIQDVFSSFYEF
jgi:acetoin utilization deacetylase AcuC-like enzyme